MSDSPFNQISPELLGPYLASFILHKIKHSNLPLTKWLTPETSSSVLTMLRSACALVNTVGVNWAWSPDGTLVIHGLTAGAAVGALGLFLQNYAYQFVFDMAHGRAADKLAEKKEGVSN